MARRVGLGPGPVFAFEWLMASRRWQGYAMRSVTVLVLLGALTLTWNGSAAARSAGRGTATFDQLAIVGQAFYINTSILLLGLVGLVAPAATAGAICQDKARGNLTLLFVTDLSDAEIVLGKLAARLVPVLGMILCAAPVLAIATLFGGVDPVGVVGALCVVLACAILGCSLALTLSVWGRKTHEVLMVTYLVEILYLLAAPIYAGVLAMLPTSWSAPWQPSFSDVARYNPVFLVLAAVAYPRPAGAPVTIATQAGFLGLVLGISALMLGAATWRIRAVVIGQLGRGETSPGLLRRAAWLLRPLRRAWPGPSLDRNPVLWRECKRRHPSRWSLAVWGVYLLFSAGFSLYAIAEMIQGDRWGREVGCFANAVQVGVGLLLLSVSAATSLAEERQRGSLDVLMATPLPTRAIVWGKWWGAFRAVPPLLILPVLVAIFLACFTGHFWGVALLAALILAHGAVITSLGLALATWIPRVGLAAALTVGVYLFMSIAWMSLSLSLLGDGAGDHGPGVAAGSPFVGVGLLCVMLGGDGPRSAFATQMLWTLFWTIAYGGVALALLLATLATFNRCLGRVDAASLRDEGDPARAGVAA